MAQPQQNPKASPMPMDRLSIDDVQALTQKAARTGARLQRKLNLPQHDAEDFRQELLLDFLQRFHKFDPARGSLGAFAKTVMAHQSSRLADRHCQQLTAQGGATLPLTEAAPLACPQSANSGACSVACSEARLGLQSALRRLSPDDRRFCHALATHPVTALPSEGFGSRSSIYRRIRRLGPQLAISGFGPGWDVFASA